ncbi:MAG: recombination mediator RecR [Patescibacteria group bacterium]|nr:recombination mediator RecR [Patescibacteria group bacterium]
MIPESIQKFIDNFSKLPSLGPRLVTRLVFYLLNLDRASLDNLIASLSNLKELDRCERCFFLKNSSEKICEICSNKSRDCAVIAIVEKETDLISIEKTGHFKGHYLILGELNERGALETIQKLRLKHLKDRIIKESNGKIKEIIIALNPNTFGDFTADIIRQEFKNLAEKITRLGRGIPTGGEIEFADEETLNSALERRN